MMPFPFLFGDKDGDGDKDKDRDGDKDGEGKGSTVDMEKRRTLPLCSLVKNLHADETSSQTPPPLDSTT